MTPAQARPHHVRVVLMLVMTLSPLALTENKYLLEFVRGLGVSYDPPAPAGVRNILLDLFSFVTDQLRAQVRRLQGLYRDVPFFHLVTDLWTERHGSGSYGSLVLRCVDPGTFSIVELHLGVAAFIGRHDHDNIRSWTERLLRRYGVRNEDVSSSTSDSGSNVKKALTQLWPRWVPCAAHTLHLAVKVALGGTGKTAAARAARAGAASSSSTSRTGGANPGAADLLSRARKIGNLFHKSTASVEKLNSVPFNGDNAPRKLLTESPTRWGSTYLALVRLFTLMPRLVEFWKLDDLTAAQRERRLWRSDWEAIRHLIGVLQPAFEACVAMQSTSLTVADALGLVCRLRRTMRLGVFPCPKPYEKPLAVGREAILLFLGLDKKRTNVMELDNRMYEHEIVPLEATRDADGLRDEAATIVKILHDEIDARFFSAESDIKNWLANDAVLAATLVTPGGAAMLRKAAARVGQENPIERARGAVLATAAHVEQVNPSAPSREGLLHEERQMCRTTLVGWDSDESDVADSDTPLDTVTRELDTFLTTHTASDDALGFWRSHEADFPLLHLVACALLGASGSSAASERDFSVAGMVLRKDRSRMLPEHVEMHCLLRFNAHLLPADPSTVPVLSEAERSRARAGMSRILVDTAVGGEASGNSTASDSDTFSGLTDEEGLW